MTVLFMAVKTGHFILEVKLLSPKLITSSHVSINKSANVQSVRFDHFAILKALQMPDDTKLSTSWYSSGDSKVSAQIRYCPERQNHHDD